MTGAPAPRNQLRTIWRWGRFLVAAVVAIVVVDVLVGRRAELQGVGRYLDHVRVGWLALAILFEAGSLLAFAALQRRLLRSGALRLGMGGLTAITVAGNAIANSLPGGPAWASLFAFRRFRERGADDTLATWTILGVGVCSAAGLAALAAVGLVVAGSGGTSFDLLSVIVVTLVLAMAALFLVRRRRGLVPAAVGVLGLTRRLVGRPRGDPAKLVERIATRMTAISPTRGQWTIAFGWGLANWIADCACLALAFIAVGVGVPWRGLLLAYGGGQLAANLPITPGGLGVVEGSLTIALVAYGGAESSTVAAVLLYRIMSFWVLLPVGYATWGGLALLGRRRRGSA